MSTYWWKCYHQVEVGGLHLALRLRGHGRARDLLPALESLRHLSAVVVSGEAMASRPEVLGNWTIGREEALGVTR